MFNAESAENHSRSRRSLRLCGETAPRSLARLGSRGLPALDEQAGQVALELAFGLAPADPRAGQIIGDRIAEFVAELGVPTRLREAGVPREQLEPLAAASSP